MTGNNFDLHAFALNLLAAIERPLDDNSDSLAPGVYSVPRWPLIPKFSGHPFYSLERLKCDLPANFMRIR